MTARTLIVAVAAAAMTLLAAVAAGQAARSGSGDVVPRLQATIQQLTLERNNLQTDKAKLEGELEEAQEKVESLTDRNKELTRQLARTETSLARTEQIKDVQSDRLEQARVQMEELIARFRKTATTLREVELERAGLAEDLAAEQAEFRICAEKNLRLYEINDELLKRYENKGFWAALRQKEPFTQLKRVEIENLVDEYRTEADDLQVKVEGDAAGGAGP